MVYVPGNKQAAADTLSREKCLTVLSSLSVCKITQLDMEDQLRTDMGVGLMELSVLEVNIPEVELGLDLMSVEAQPSVITWSRLQEATKEDKILTKLIEAIQTAATRC